MKPHSELLDVKHLLEAAYRDVRQLGSGLSVFLLVCKRNRAANISIAEEGWFVELWEADNEHVGEDICVREFIVAERDEALAHIRDWLDAEEDDAG